MSDKMSDIILPVERAHRGLPDAPILRQRLLNRRVPMLGGDLWNRREKHYRVSSDTLSYYLNTYMSRLGFAGQGILLTLAVLAVTSACATTGRSSPGEEWEYVVVETPRIAAAPLVSGTLRYRDSTIPEYFSEIVIGRRRFTYVFRMREEPFRGYRLEESEEPRSPETSGDSLSGRERNRGWYLGDREVIRPGTPENWIWVRRENVAGWVAPDSLAVFAEEHDFPPMRQATTRQQSRVRVNVRVRQSFGTRW